MQPLETLRPSWKGPCHLTATKTQVYGLLRARDALRHVQKMGAQCKVKDVSTDSSFGIDIGVLAAKRAHLIVVLSVILIIFR